MTETSVPPAVTKPEPVILDGATLTPRKLALIAREGAVVQLAEEARAANDDARVALAAFLARGGEVYGVTTGVGALRAYRVPDDQQCGAGDRDGI